MEENARKQPWTVTLDDGTAIGGLTLSGNNFISDTELTPEMFDGKLSKVTATDGENNLEWNNAELVQITHPDDRWWFEPPPRQSWTIWLSSPIPTWRICDHERTQQEIP